MLSFWIYKLSRATGLPVREASEIWSRHVLSGFRSWRPWACLALSVALYASLRFGYVAIAPASYRGVLATLALLLGAFGTWWLASLAAYPAALTAARQRAHP